MIALIRGGWTSPAKPLCFCNIKHQGKSILVQQALEQTQQVNSNPSAFLEGLTARVETLGISGKGLEVAAQGSPLIGPIICEFLLFICRGMVQFCHFPPYLSTSCSLFLYSRHYPT